MEFTSIRALIAIKMFFDKNKYSFSKAVSKTLKFLGVTTQSQHLHDTYRKLYEYTDKVLHLLTEKNCNYMMNPHWDLEQVLAY
jgi:hypothetical protein